MDSVMGLAQAVRRDSNTADENNRIKWTVVITVGVVFILTLAAVLTYLYLRAKRKNRAEDRINHQLDDYGIDPQEPDANPSRGGAGAPKYRYEDGGDVRRPESAHSNSGFGLQMQGRGDSMGRSRV